MDDKTISYFDIILNSVKAFKETSNDSIFLTNKELIFLIHKNLSNEEYKDLSTTDFLKLLVKSGVFLKLNLGRFHPGKITVNGETATALLTSFASEENTDCSFSKGKKDWKIDLSSVVPYLSKTLTK